MDLFVGFLSYISGTIAKPFVTLDQYRRDLNFNVVQPYFYSDKMARINSEVEKVKKKVEASRSKLAAIERNGKQNLGAQVGIIKGLLEQGDKRALQVSIQTRLFISDVENALEAGNNTVDIQPQAQWLQRCFRKMINSLDATKKKADEAISTTEQLTYNVMDVGQEVKVGTEKLTRCQREVEEFANKSQAEFEASEELVRAAQQDIDRKGLEIRKKNAELENKKRRKQEIIREIAEAQRQIEEAIRERDRKTQGAITGGVLMGVGLLAAIPTFGLSLGLTAVGAGVTAHNVGGIAHWENEANSRRAALSGLEREIMECATQLPCLEVEKLQLQSAISELEADLEQKQSVRDAHRKQVESVNLVQENITEVISHTHATAEMIRETLPELKNIKLNLDQCSDMIRQKHEDLKQISDNLPSRPTGRKRIQEFNRKIRLIKDAVETLDRVHSETASLGFNKTDGRFIENVKPTVNVEALQVEEPIPTLAYHE